MNAPAAASPNARLWQRFWELASPYWRSEERWKATGLVLLLVLLLLSQTGFAVLLNEQTGEFTSALAAREAARFWHAIFLSLCILLGAVPTYAFYYFVRDTLGNHWRRWLTHNFLQHYFRDRHFYTLNGNALVDNPDQRIAEDINTFSQKSLFFLLVLIGSSLQLIAFSRVLWSISHGLVYFLVVYAIAGTLITLFVYGRPLTALNFRQLQREADLRFSLMRVREKAEAIALYRGESQEMQRVTGRFGRVFDNYRQVVRRQLYLNLFQYAYGMLTIVLPSAIIAGPVLAGELEVGNAVRAAGAFTAVLSAVSVIVDNFEGLSRFAAGVERLDTFLHSLNGQAPDGVPQAAPMGRIESVEGANGLALDTVTVQTPDQGRVLVRDLSIAVPPGEGLMIVGASGCGKSSLLRAIAGVWSAGSGRIVRPASEDMLFLPQQPYMLQGTLRAQLLYPQTDNPVPDATLLALLQQVNLPDLAQRFGGLDTEHDWEKLLSMGEQQRLAFARVLLHKPHFAILDEATSALDLANESHLYRLMQSTQTTLISVGHRSTILQYHRQVLELTGDGHWQHHPAATYRFTQ
jgi:vitamin B12/bleomycin/antimicrobial peptide transport system ATP-binding/permease protein